MVSARTRMLARDLWHLRGQVFAAAMVVACGIAALIGMYSTSYSLVEARRKYYVEYRLADVFAQLKRAPQSLAADIARIPGVVQVDTRVVRGVTLDIPNLTEPASARLLSIPEQSAGGLNRLRLMRGRYARVGAADEVITSETFAGANHIGPGDRISAILNGRWQTLRIVGTALSPEYVYEVAPGGLFPDNRRFGVLWMNREALGAAFDMNGAFNDVALVLARGAPEADVIARLDRLLRPYGGLAAYGRSEQPSNRFLSDELAEIQVMSTVIPVLFLGVAGFLLYVVLSRVVSMQRAEIALLKAFGYSDWSVGAHYLGFAAATGGIGVVIGIPVGVYLGQGFVGLYRMYFHFPKLELVTPPELPVWVAILTLSAAGLGALAAVRRAASLPPAEAMRPEPPARFRAGWPERIGLIRQVAPATRMVIRNVTRRPVKALLSVTTIAMAIGLMVAGRFALDAVDAMLELQFEQVQREDVALTFIEPRSGSALLDASHMFGVTRVEGFRAVPAWIRAGYRTKRVEIVGVSPDQQLRRVVDQHSLPVRVPADGLVLGEKLAEILDVRPGDAVTVEVLEGTRRTGEVRVSALVDELLGLGAYMNAPTLSRMLGERDAVSGAYLRADGAHAKELFAQLKRTPVVAGVSSRNALRTSIEDSMTRTFNVFSIGLTAFAAVIVVGMVYNSMRVALSERGNELASLRVLGFTEREIGLILLGEQALVTIAAVPIGLLIGYGLCAILVPAFSREAFRLPLVLRNQTFVYAAGTAMIAALGCGVLVARRLRNLDLIADTEDAGMKRHLLRWVLSAGATVLAAAALYALLRPKPVEVDVSPVQRGPLTVTVDEQAETRSHDRFVVAAPVAGRVLRVNLHEGDVVTAGQPIAELAPVPLGEREIRELEARLTSARSLQREAQERLSSAEQDLGLAGRNRARLQGLAARKLVAEQALDQAMAAETAAAHAVRAAAHRLASAAADVDHVRAGLISTSSGSSGSAVTVLVRAPVAGRVLRVPEKSDRVVPAGSQLVVVGDLSHLEVLIELLSIDAVKIRAGMPVLLDGWGGDRVLHARVSVVEPFAFTKISALGVEEKRANVIAEFLEPPAPLGDGYRLNAHIVTFSADSVVKVAASALFPCAQGFCLFAIEDARARQRSVSIGHRTPDSAEVLGGVTIGTNVICYPPNDLQDGARIKVRPPPGR